MKWIIRDFNTKLFENLTILPRNSTGKGGISCTQKFMSAENKVDRSALYCRNMVHSRNLLNSAGCTLEPPAFLTFDQKLKI